MGYRIEVRGRPDADGLIHRIGELDTWLKLDMVLRHNAPGSFQLLVKDRTRQAKLLEKGGGIAVWMDGRAEPIFTGQFDQFQKYWTTEQHTAAGSIYVGGKCDNRIPYGYLAFPGTQGEGDVRTVLPTDRQWAGQDRRTYGFEAGQALWVEYDMAFGQRGLPGRQIPSVNMGPKPATAGTPPKIGKKIGGTLRYDSLGTLTESWTKEGEIGYRFLWNPDRKKIELSIFTPVDRSKQVRFSPELGNLREFVATLSAPRATRVIVACQGEGSERYIKQFPEAGATDEDGQPVWLGDRTQDELEWGTVLEQFLDRRDVPLKTSKAGTPELVTKTSSDGFEEIGQDPEGRDWTPDLTAKKAALAAATSSVEAAEKAAAEAKTDNEKTLAAARLAMAKGAQANAQGNLRAAITAAKPVVVKHHLDAIKAAAAAVFKENAKNGNFQIYPIQTPQCRFGIHYFLGDKVSVDVDDEVYVDVVREVAITVEDGGRTESVVPKIGEQGTGEPLNLYKHISEMREKLRKLESRM
ncbi:siphovirus ReqiPepy6 Gp37-like family protein [Streptomyces sp. G1]|uniref:siphovirus ReqiPepy6 Gp37-like family protein n=1 Tax=Streptomyces sp. G1 TaxID=361572 RepID=UPI0020309047|nr:siphovirus ReqiPepy6 Gp37-like family protein [Streptomyces sp. G1]MCM1967790.1 siphovirus ReqiPepy6 Gp37-like family protein [Streptomyces sp. G1]